MEQKDFGRNYDRRSTRWLPVSIDVALLPQHRRNQYEESMNIAQVNQSGETGIGLITGMPTMNVSPTTTRTQPIVTNGAGLNEATPEERRLHIAGAPYYRRLLWDF